MPALPPAEREALPLMPLAEPAGEELELLEALLSGVVAPGAELALLLELPEGGGVTAVELLELPEAGGVMVVELLELDGAVLEPGAVLAPALEDELPGRETSLDLDADWSRLQPVVANAMATAAATSVS